MANNRTLTATDAIVSIIVPGFSGVPLIIDEFEIDNVWQLSKIAIAQTVMTLDGKLAGGYIPSSVDFTVNILPTSNAKQFFVDMMQASKANRSMFRSIFNITVFGEKVNYILTDCVMVEGDILPNVNSILQPVSYTFRASSEAIVATALI